MIATRHRSAWIWLAVAAMSIAFVARAQAGLQNAKAYTTPVLEFLTGHQSEQLVATTGVTRLLHHHTARQTRVIMLHGADSGPWTAMLPVLFIGLVSPLNLLSPKSVLCSGRAPAALALPASFQRPPPSQIA